MIKKKKLVIAVLCTFCLAVVMFNVTPVRAQGTITINADGSISPLGAPMQQNGNVYTLTGNITSNSVGIEIERSNIIIDGAGYTVQGYGGGEGLDSSMSNVTIKHTNVQNFFSGIFLYSSSSNSISGNNIAKNGFGMWLDGSSGNNISGNNLISNSYEGIWLSYSSSHNSVIGNYMTNDRSGITINHASNYNIISGNNMTANNGSGITDDSSSNTIVFGNNLTANAVDGITLSVYDYPSYNNSVYGNSITANKRYGIYLYGSLSNSIHGNNVINNNLGIFLEDFSEASSNNAIYHNNVINNTVQVVSTNSTNIWDNGYPSGGNYWSNYNGTDGNSDGIGDSPYILNGSSDVDNYPLMHLWKVGDATYDGKVNVLDLIFIATRLGTRPGDLSWNPRADVKEDNVINVLDLIACATHLGK